MNVQKPAIDAAMRMARVRRPAAAFIARGTGVRRRRGSRPCYAWVCVRALWAGVGGGRPRGAWLAALQRRARTGERVGRRAGRVDLIPVDMAEIVALLLARNPGIGVGGVGQPGADARDAGREVGGEEQ